MPYSVLLLLYGFCILTGILLVLKGISLRSADRRQKEQSVGGNPPGGDESPPDLEDPLPLQFLEEGRCAPQQRVGSPGFFPLESDPEGSGFTIGAGASKERPGKLRFLKAPFRAFRRKEREGEHGVVLDQPVSWGVVLNPKVAGKPAKPATEEGMPKGPGQ